MLANYDGWVATKIEKETLFGDLAPKGVFCFHTHLMTGGAPGGVLDEAILHVPAMLAWGDGIASASVGVVIVIPWGIRWYIYQRILCSNNRVSQNEAGEPLSYPGQYAQP